MDCESSTCHNFRQKYITQRIHFTRLLTSNLVDVLQWQSQWLVRWTFWWVNVVQRIHDCHARVLLLVGLCHLPALEPRHLCTALQHVVTVPAGDRHERHSVRIVADLLDVCRDLLLNLIVTRLSAQFNSLQQLHGISTRSIKLPLKCSSVFFNTSFYLTFGILPSVL